MNISDRIGAVRNAARAHRDLSWVACEAEPHMADLLAKLSAEGHESTEEIIGELLRRHAVYVATMCGRCGDLATVRATMDPPMPTPTLYRRCEECLPALWRMAERAGRSLILTSL